MDAAPGETCKKLCPLAVVEWMVHAWILPPSLWWRVCAELRYSKITRKGGTRSLTPTLPTRGRAEAENKARVEAGNDSPLVERQTTGPLVNSPFVCVV